MPRRRRWRCRHVEVSRRAAHITVGVLCSAAAVVLAVLDDWWVACALAVAGIGTLLYTPRQR